jgi:hypothetical protein
VEPAEAVPEHHVIAHCDAQAAHLVVRVPEDRKDVRPVLQLRFDPTCCSGGDGRSPVIGCHSHLR